MFFYLNFSEPLGSVDQYISPNLGSFGHHFIIFLPLYHFLLFLELLLHVLVSLMSHKYLSSINASSFLNLLICGSVWIISIDSCSLSLILSFTVSHPLLVEPTHYSFHFRYCSLWLQNFHCLFFVILMFLLRFPIHGAIFIIFVFNSSNRVCII